jgi:hypothetical protein
MARRLGEGVLELAVRERPYALLALQTQILCATLMVLASLPLLYLFY